MRIYMATWLLEPAQGTALTKCSARTRLISYYHTQEKKEHLLGYIKTGLVPATPKVGR